MDKVNQCTLLTHNPSFRCRESLGYLHLSNDAAVRADVSHPHVSHGRAAPYCGLPSAGIHSRPRYYRNSPHGHFKAVEFYNGHGFAKREARRPRNQKTVQMRRKEHGVKSVAQSDSSEGCRGPLSMPADFRRAPSHRRSRAGSDCVSSLRPPADLFSTHPSQSVSPASIAGLKMTLPTLEDVFPEHMAALLTLVPARDPLPAPMPTLMVLTKVVHGLSNAPVARTQTPSLSLDGRRRWPWSPWCL